MSLDMPWTLREKMGTKMKLSVRADVMHSSNNGERARAAESTMKAPCGCGKIRADERE